MTDLREAAQQALEALEEYQSKGAPFLACDGAVAALRAALAQQDEPVQEPVAWLYEEGADSTLHWNKPPLYGTPLYTTPPQRKPLTQEMAALTAQRDALLEALKDAAKTIEHLGYPLAAIERARAVIKAVEETK